MSLRSLLLPFLAAAGLVVAGPRPYNVDRSHSEIKWTVEAKLLDVEGFFDSFTVNVQFDPDTVIKSTVQITIDPKSVNTRVTRRDGHLRSCDFFCADSFPTINFQSNRVLRVGPDRYRIEGDLTMRGVTRPVSVPARMIFNEPNGARFSGTFDVNRRDFGVNGDGGGGIINDSVHVAFNFSLRVPRNNGAPGAPGGPPQPGQAPTTPPRSQ